MGISGFSKLFGSGEYVETKYANICDIELMDINRNEVTLKDTDMKNLSTNEISKYFLIVNVASKHLSSVRQLEDLKQNCQGLYNRGVQVVLVPSNSFDNEPNNFEKIKEIYHGKWDLKYPLLSKFDVNGIYLHP